jgi:hypothetical protein
LCRRRLALRHITRLLPNRPATAHAFRLGVDTHEQQEHGKQQGPEFHDISQKYINAYVRPAGKISSFNT